MGKTTGQPLLKNGSKGDDVKKLQQSLINAGYNVGKTGADGILGKNTEAAIKKYQKDNGLAVDGIAGKNTLGSLYGTNKVVAVDADGNVASPDPKKPTKGSGGGAGSGAEEPTAETTGGAGFSVDPYQKSEIVQQADALLAQHNASAPTYSSQWQAQINEYLNKIMNREEFSYNFNEDALYQQYKDIYTQMGLMAMMDTMGQASAMTGGYGNSYAQTVGQQAYNQQLSQLNNVLPELYQMAFDRYAYEGEQLYNQYGMLMDQENMDYNRYMDSYNQWADQRDYLAGQANTLYNQEWNQYLESNDQAWNAYTANYQEGRDTIADQRYDYGELYDLISSTGYEPTEDQLKAAGMSSAEAKALKDAYTASVNKGNGNSPGGNTTGSANWDNGDLTESQVKMLQKALGVTVDGKWGDESFEAAGNMTADEALKAYQRGELGKKPEQGNPAEPEPVTMSDAAKKFMSNLPYAHAGSSAETWKNVVLERLEAQYDSGTLTEEDVEAIMIKLGL